MYGRIAIVDDREEKIRHRAYALWQAAGEPIGFEYKFWWQAEEELRREEAAPSGEIHRDSEVSPVAGRQENDGTATAEPRAAADLDAVAHAGDKPGHSGEAPRKPD
jgi:hypothetical protein